MNKTINDIMEKYKAGEITIEEANAQRKEADAGFSLNPEKNPGGGWTEAEMAEGFMPGEEREALPKTPDMRRRKELAGQIVEQETASGPFMVEYDEDGYAVKATRKR